MDAAFDALSLQHEVTGIGADWYREWRVFLHEKSRIVASVINSFLWLFVFGSGFGHSVSIPSMNYQAFIFPGILAQAALFSSNFFGVYIVWDRKIDFFKDVLVAPISRISVFLGKAVGGATDSVVRSPILLVLRAMAGHFGWIPTLHLGLARIVGALMVLALTTAGLVSAGPIIGSFMENP